MCDVNETLFKLKNAMKADKRKMILSGSFDEKTATIFLKDKYLTLISTSNYNVELNLCEKIIDTLIKEL